MGIINIAECSFYSLWPSGKWFAPSYSEQRQPDQKLLSRYIWYLHYTIRRVSSPLLFFSSYGQQKTKKWLPSNFPCFICQHIVNSQKKTIIASHGIFKVFRIAHLINALRFSSWLDSDVFWKILGPDGVPQWEKFFSQLFLVWIVGA